MLTKIKPYLAVMRLDHWFKNSFIFVGTFLAIYFFNIDLNINNILLIVLSFLFSSFISSVNYIINEILDAKYDKFHPEKKFRPIPSGKAKVKYLLVIIFILLVFSILGSYLIFSKYFLISIIMLLFSGIIYNVPPIRVKEIPFLDVLAESFNNPIRLLIGWFTFQSISTFPPLSILLAFWFFGALLMAGKRYSEYKFLNDKEMAGAYRKSFKFYSEKILIISMVVYANLLFFFIGVFMVSYNKNLIFSLPFIIGEIIIYFNLTFENKKLIREPEKIYKHPLFILYNIALLIIIYICLHLPADLTAKLNFFKLLK